MSWTSTCDHHCGTPQWSESALLSHHGGECRADAVAELLLTPQSLHSRLNTVYRIHDKVFCNACKRTGHHTASYANALQLLVLILLHFILKRRQSLVEVNQ